MDIITDKQLLDLIEDFLRKHDMKPSAFGRAAINDPALVFQLREGKRSLSLKTLLRVSNFMEGHASQSEAA